MIQYIASDLDGTLLPDGGQDMNPEIFDLILQLKERGIRWIPLSPISPRRTAQRSAPSDPLAGSFR